MKKYSVEKITLVAIPIVGVLASLAQFIYNGSLWEGVVNLTLNIMHRSHLELLQPLDYFQVAGSVFAN